MRRISKPVVFNLFHAATHFATQFNPKTTEIFLFKNYQWGQLTPALNMSGFFARCALVIASLSCKWILKCDFCLWWRQNEFTARFAHAQWQCSCLISLPGEIVDSNCSNVMLRQGPSLLKTFGGTNFVWHACYYAHHTNKILLVAFRWRHHVHSTIVWPFCKIGKLWKWYILTPLPHWLLSLVLWQLQRVLCYSRTMITRYRVTQKDAYPYFVR